MELLAAGVNHTTADVELRGQLAFVADKAELALRALAALPGVAEVALLSTCNRMELYCLCEEQLDLVAWLAEWHQLSPERVRQSLYVHHQEEALRHMMQVAAGLDSLVLGEPQILGQMHDAYREARHAGTLGSELERAFQQIFAVAKRVRSETAIGENPVSMASAAVSFARHLFTDLSQSRVLLVGAGEMIALVARHLREQKVGSLTIANRTMKHAADLAGEVDAGVIPLTQLTEGLAAADVVIACTGSPVPVITLTQAVEALRRRRHKPIFMVDLAVPKDIEPAVGELQDVYLYTIDHLHQIIDQNLTERQQAAAEGQAIIDQALASWQVKQREMQAVDTLKAYREQVEALSVQLLDKARQALDKGQNADEVLARFRHDMVNKLLHQPTRKLRQLAAEQRLDELALAHELLIAEAVDAKRHDKE